jgi:hypothetical protein
MLIFTSLDSRWEDKDSKLHGTMVPNLTCSRNTTSSWTDLSEQQAHIFLTVLASVFILTWAHKGRGEGKGGWGCMYS